MDKGDLRKLLEERFNKYNFMTCKETREEFIERMIEINYLILTTREKFLDICLNFRRKSTSEVKPPARDMIQFNCKLLSLIYGLKLEPIKERYTDSYEEVEERMLFRTELYKEGWTVEQIEKYIYKYMYKTDYDLTKYDLEEYTVRYNNVLNKIIEYKKEREKKLGRPSLPIFLKNYLKSKHASKVRENMRERYRSSDKYESIKEFLLTKDELEGLKTIVDDENILDKLQMLTL